MKPVALAGHADFHRAGRAIGLGLLFLLAPLLSAIQPEELVETSVHPSTFFTPAVNATSVNLTSTNMLSIPANETFLDGTLDITPTWMEAGLTGHRFGVDLQSGWSGDHNNTQGIGHGGQLSLAPSSTLATLTDFETLVETLPDWEGQGTDHGAWNVHLFPSSSPPANHPANATDGQRALATQAYGGLQANMTGCIASPAWDVPAFVSRFNLTFDHWLSFGDDDAAWMEWRGSSGAWSVLSPSVPYPNVSSLSSTPSTTWAGQTTAWQSVHVSLDTLMTGSSTTVQFRFCFKTSPDAGEREGWFIDNFTLSNEGDLPGAWFHGNMTGDYANNANGRLYLHADVSGLTGPLEVEYWANWDLEGGFADNLLLSLSMNNGSTWTIVSGIPGMPGNGFTSQGTFYMDESQGWIPISYSLPNGLASHPNASQALFEFHVQTNHQTGYGGFASSGWEGVFIDDVVLHHRRGTPQASVIQLANFTINSSDQYGDSSGWLEHSPQYINQWAWTTNDSMNGPETTRVSFENSIATPPGWAIEGDLVNGWEIGQTRNTSGYGPGEFFSGANGAAINLTTRYVNNIYTHLVTEEYSIPTNASARLSFRSWVCTEANWDGGGVSISTDEGQTWWWLPPDVNGFHDQISTVNTNSPFFGQGIIDGSQQPNGCGSNKQRPFELKTYDISNLSGQAVKARFSFFSDTFVEADGWYIDDAGIEIDVFETSGAWTSPSLTPDELYGYGWLDGWFEQPDGTTLSIDVLDAQLNPIHGHQGLSLPAQLAIDPLEHASVHVRVSMTTNNTYVTPTVHSMVLGRTVFLGPQHIMDLTSGQHVASINDDGALEIHAPFSLSLPEYSACPFDGFRLITVGDNLTWNMPNQQLISMGHVAQPQKTTYLNHSLGGDLRVSPALTVSASGGEVVERAKLEFDCVRPTQQPSLRLGWNNLTVFDWPPDGMGPSFGLNDHWSETYHASTALGWNETAPSPQFHLNNSTLTYTYLTLAQTVQPSFGLGATATLLVNNRSAATSLLVNGVNQPLVEDSDIVTVSTNTGCPSASQTRTYSANVSVYRCELKLTLSGTADVKALNLMHLAGSPTLSVEINASTLNSAKAASDEGDVRAVLDLPLHIMTEAGGVRVGLSANTLPLMNEYVDPPTYERWLPETTVEFTTHHQRENPLDQGEDAPDIEEVDFYLSSTPSIEASFVHVRVDQIQTSPRFRQLAGAGFAYLNPSSSTVSCSLNTCSIDWTLTSTWLLDDVDDVHVLIQATDDAGLHVGPSVFVRKTPFNEVENDLEVVDFTVLDSLSRRLDDWTNSFWPYHLGENESMVAQGRVRMEGIAGQWVLQGQGEASVTLRAVPPKNTSGGPDEWPSDPVNWSQTWSAEIGQGGWFSIPLTSPSQTDAIPSNTWLELVPSLSRRGPSTASFPTSEDRTVVLNPTRLLHDTVAPEVNALHILDSGSEVPADGHIIMLGRDLPLRLSLSDPEGLDSVLQVWTWMEKQDDDNGDGVMDAEEYTMQTLSLNRGVTALEVDLPLIASTDIVPDGAFEGRLSVVVKGGDLAGNSLLAGGNFGESTDLATVIVQQRADTTADLDDILLDTVNGRLLAGHTHRFSYTLADANGLSSLDELQLFLVGEDQPEVCFVHYQPRFGDLTYDTDCFMQPPAVTVSQRPLTSIYDVSVEFRLGWNASQTLVSNGGTPSLKVIDEGQDLGLGLYRLSATTWVPSVDLEMRWMNISDTTAPYGDANETTRWFHRNDVVHHRIGIYHENTSILAQEVPGPGHLKWVLSDGERTSSNNLNITPSGELEFNVSMNENTLYNDDGSLTLAVEGFDAFSINDLTYDLVMDDRAPKLVLSPGTLERLDSNALKEVRVTVSINDDTHMPPSGLAMHSVFYRMGQPLEGTERIDQIPITEVVSEYTVYNATVNFEPTDVTLIRSDILIVWFEASDRSGRTLTGLGTATAPLNVAMTWVAFEPVFTDLSATPFRPKVGENVSVYARVANNGLLAGEFEVLLRDDEGGVLANETVQLNTSEWVNFVWNIEAWKVGRLGLSVEIVNHTPLVPIPLADIQANDGDGSSSSMATLSLSVLALVIAGVVLFTVRQQRFQRQEAYHLERIRRIVSYRQPPPIPQDIMETRQEE
ncbi:MAG: hypothetical protein DWC10_06295 [Candidatus Poseidoniales archaeon]|nr:MAG: hypothetical protein DWC10_06295 [Candidatus Poseidoniales archaeon]